MMWVEYIPIGGDNGERLIVNLATANKLYFETGGKGWWVKADLTGKATALCPRAMSREDAKQAVRALIAQIKAKADFVELEQWYPPSRVGRRGER